MGLKLLGSPSWPRTMRPPYLPTTGLYVSAVAAGLPTCGTPAVAPPSGPVVDVVEPEPDPPPPALSPRSHPAKTRAQRLSSSTVAKGVGFFMVIRGLKLHASSAAVTSGPLPDTIMYFGDIRCGECD